MLSGLLPLLGSVAPLLLGVSCNPHSPSYDLSYSSPRRSDVEPTSRPASPYKSTIDLPLQPSPLDTIYPLPESLDSGYVPPSVYPGSNQTTSYPPYSGTTTTPNGTTYRICPDKQPGHQNCNYPATILTRYDFIVVGAGIGGGIVSSNLARRGHKVLLLEAGTDQHNNLNVTVPILNFKSSEDDQVSWRFFVTHYNNVTRAMRDPKLVYTTPNGTEHVGPGAPPGSEIKGIFYPRGATIGGSGAHNALVNIYPHATDWDDIANLTGDSSWNAENMRNYWKQMEHSQYVSPGAEGHGFNGWLHTNRAAHNIFTEPKFVSMMSAAAEVAKNPVSSVQQLIKVLGRDINALSRTRDEEKGLYAVPLFMNNNKRGSVANHIVNTYHARNDDGSKKYSLDIRTNCLVTRIIFDQTISPPKAIGVEFLDGESLYRADPRAGADNLGTPGVAYSTREVILSGGAYNSPQILKLSGVGPVDELKKFDIPVVVDLPGVGGNLQDRYETSVVSKTNESFLPYINCTLNAPGIPDPCLQEWYDNPTNTSLYAAMGVVGGIIHRSTYATNKDDDIFVFGGDFIFRGYFPGYSVEGNEDLKHWTWAVLKAHTGNQGGTVKLVSPDPRAMPAIDFNYFDSGTSDAADADAGAVVEGLKIGRQIMATQAKRPGAAQYTEILPGPNVTTDAQLKQYVEDYAWGHHCSCSNPIGTDDDPKAVLNSKFQVRGTSGLRVVDASVFPHIPGVFIAAPVYIMSNKASDVIAQDAEQS